MKLIDLLRMSSASLFKRKVRTILTVLGVVIGVSSIVVMISLGLGLSRSLMQEYESFGSLTEVTVSEGYSDDNSAEAKRLDDNFIKELEKLEHVESVYPVLRTNALAFYGGYVSNLEVVGMPLTALERENIHVGEGRLPSVTSEDLEFFYGNQVLQNFYNEKTGKGYWDTGELPEIDLLKDPIFVIFDTDAYYNSKSGRSSSDGTIVSPPKKYLVPCCGVEESQENVYTQYGWSTYCDIEQLETRLKKVFKGKVIPGQPTMKNGKPYKELFYSQLKVEVDDMENVMDVQNLINEWGYNAYSNTEWIQSNQKTMGYIQAVLGGIGAVSLLVAAIGITNTMMMSIYERTKEIGVMKVLGCDLRNIQMLFLLEAGFIGLIGGIIGLIFSYGISIIINTVTGNIGMDMNHISYIPWWLAIISLLFAILVGMVSGFFPARRAMKLSPLAAIRNE